MDSLWHTQLCEATLLIDDIKRTPREEAFMAHFAAVARRVVTDIVIPIALRGDPTDTGCCVALWEKVIEPITHWKLICVVSIGDISADQSLRYGFHSIKKGYSLSLYDDRVLSFEIQDTSSRNSMEHIYQGAVRMGECERIVSTSGFASPVDELADHLIGLALGWQAIDSVMVVAKISNNQAVFDYFATVEADGQ
jgi:hypothetical protein